MGGNAGGAAPGLHRSLLTPPAPISPLRLKISHLDSIFLSRVAWANVGGLPGEGGGGPGGLAGCPGGSPARVPLARSSHRQQPV